MSMIAERLTNKHGSPSATSVTSATWIRFTGMGQRDIDVVHLGRQESPSGPETRHVHIGTAEDYAEILSAALAGGVTSRDLDARPGIVIPFHPDVVWPLDWKQWDRLRDDIFEREQESVRIEELTLPTLPRKEQR